MLEGAVIVDVDVGALTGNAETGPQLLCRVVDVWDRTGSGALDELWESSGISETGNADDGDLISELFLYLCDRRGFSASKRSPGGPVPKDHILTLELREIDRFTSSGRKRIGQQRGLSYRCITRSVASTSFSFNSLGSSGVWSVRSATTGAKQKKCSCQEPNDSGATAKQTHR